MRSLEDAFKSGMSKLAQVLIFGILVSYVSAQSPAWGQCGGLGWSGPTTCISGYSCVLSNPYYSQCLLGTASSSTNGGTTSTSTRTTTTSTTTISGSAPTGSQIRTVQDPVFHFYLQNNGGVPVLGPESSSGYFTLGSAISLNQANGTKLFLNIDSSATASYKSLIFGPTAITTDWGLEGDTIITTSPRQLNFLACASSVSTIYNVYLQQGNDMPAGKSCTLVTMHLPCLC